MGGIGGWAGGGRRRLNKLGFNERGNLTVALG